MRSIVPLDRKSLLAIPTSLKDKFYLGGPYELMELLQEPELYGDEDVDWRNVEITDVKGVKSSSAYIEVTSGFCRMNSCVLPSQAARVTQKHRYLYRGKVGAMIEGAVTIEVSYLLSGVTKQFSVENETVIHSIYVEPSSRGRGIARVLLAEVLNDSPNVKVHPQFSEDGAKLFGFNKHGKRTLYKST